jgi:uncharacterized protein with GYD domain
VRAAQRDALTDDRLDHDIGSLVCPEHRIRQDREKGGRKMAHYSLEVAYTPTAWAALLKDPQHRLEAIKPVVERLGGAVVNGWFVFGEYDLLMICELPDHVSAAALSMAISAGAAIKSAKTTPLMTFDDGLEALRKAKDAEYAPPRSEIPYFGVYRGRA